MKVTPNSYILKIDAAGREVNARAVGYNASGFPDKWVIHQGETFMSNIDGIFYYLKWQENQIEFVFDSIDLAVDTYKKFYTL